MISVVPALDAVVVRFGQLPGGRRPRRARPGAPGSSRRSRARRPRTSKPRSGRGEDRVEGQPRAAASAAQAVPPRSTSGEEHRRPSRRARRTTSRRLEQAGARASTVSSVDHDAVAGRAGRRRCARPPPWSLTSLRTLNARSARPRVAATRGGDERDAVGAHRQAADGRRVVGDRARGPASATSTIASGAQDRLLGVDEPLDWRPDLRTKRRAAPSARAGAARTRSRASLTTAPPRPRRRAPRRRSKRRGPRRARWRSRRRRRSGSSATTIPRPQLKTRTISSALHAAARAGSRRRSPGVSKLVEVDRRAEPVGQDRARRCRRSPRRSRGPRACTPRPRSPRSARTAGA